jgi:hypothetical protein
MIIDAIVMSVKLHDIHQNSIVKGILPLLLPKMGHESKGAIKALTLVARLGIDLLQYIHSASTRQVR